MNFIVCEARQRRSKKKDRAEDPRRKTDRRDRKRLSPTPHTHTHSMKLRGLFTASAGLLATIVSAEMELNLLTDYIDTLGSRCLDGTAGAYYIEKSAKASTKWMVFFEGGGWCYNDKDCANRAQYALGSSNSYEPTADRMGGVGSADCDVNPAFCDFNFVYLKYCDGNSFSGAREGTVHVDETDQDLHFRGHYILQAALTDVVAKQGMDQVTELVLSGCSAGGLSTFLHSDYVNEYVQTLVKQDFKVRGVALLRSNEERSNNSRTGMKAESTTCVKVYCDVTSHSSFCSSYLQYGAIPVSGFFLMNRQNVHDEFVMAS